MGQNVECKNIEWDKMSNGNKEEKEIQNGTKRRLVYSGDPSPNPKRILIFMSEHSRLNLVTLFTFFKILEVMCSESSNIGLVVLAIYVACRI